MEVEAEAEPLEPVVFVEAGDSGWDLKSCRRNPAYQARVSKSHAALEVDNYFADVVSDDELNPLKYWKINSGRFPLLSKLAIEIYPCPATTAGIERIFSIAGHLIRTRATTMKDDN